MTKTRIEKAAKGAVVAGTGFIPLDIVYRDDAPKRMRATTGGTCGNVMAILAFLGWDSYPIARHDQSAIAQTIKDDLKPWGIHQDFLHVGPTALPPVVVQRIFAKPRGGKTHSFLWTCPGCGAPLPTYKPVLASRVPEIVARLPKVKAFFFDRVSRAALDLAKAASEAGSVVIFEPSMIGEPRLFTEALSICHVLKYSQERITNVNELRGKANPPIEIETLGSAGVRYRFGKRRWIEMGAYALARPIDTSGAGDWLTAGLVHKLCQRGRRGLDKVTEHQVEDAIKLGQAMATWNCQFQGARGAMYGAIWKEWKDSVQHVLSAGMATTGPAVMERSRSCPEVLYEICCQNGSSQQLRSSSKEEMTSRTCATLLQRGELGTAIPQ
jgi:sugar/nucleoside kinase (ribokinase family)